MLTDLYLFNFLVNLKTVIEITCFISIGAVLVSSFAFCVTYSGDKDDPETMRYSWIFKIACYICIASFFMFLLAPDKEVLALMMIAPYIEDNRQAIQALPKELGDFLLEVIKQWK